jgi:tetratricopeptide (TPR) repeat protein
LARLAIGFAMISRFLYTFFLLFTCGAAAAQSAAMGGSLNSDPFATAGGSTAGTRTFQSNGAVLVLKVIDEQRLPLDRQAVIKLLNKSTQDTAWQTTADQSEAYFTDLVVGQYEIEASAVGYLTVHKAYSVVGAYTTYHEDVVLQRDPTSIDLTAPNAPEMPSNARKATQRGVRALKSGNLKEAQKQLEAALKTVPNNADVNFLLGYLYFQKMDFQNAQNYLVKAVTANPRDVQALTLLGRVRLHRGDAVAAKATLEDAVTTDPDYWMAHYLLADAYLQQHDYEKAREQAEIAIDRSKGGGNSVRLVLGQALANLGKNDNAISALEAYLKQSPESPQATQVRDLIVKIRLRALQPQASLAVLDTSLSEPLVDDTALRLSIKTWEPAGVDDSRPLVSSGVSCPEGQVIANAGAGVKQLVDDISKFSAIEELLHENVDELGHAITKETKHYNYLAEISEGKAGYLEVSEYRTERGEVPQFPDNIVTNGFPTLAFVFHPAMWANFEFSCEGMGDLNGKAMWLVHFRQRENMPNRIQSMKVGATIYSVNLKGRAWITPDKFQIARVESDLTKPMPNIQLLTEHQIVEYGPVQFPRKNVELWLPKRAELYFDFRKHRFHRRHSFDHFMLFSTDSEEKYAGPRGVPITPSLPAEEKQKQ